MINALHDQIDAREDLVEEARARVAAVKEKVIALAKESPDFETLLDEIALLVENEGAELTTKAVRQGFASAKKVAATKAVE